MVLKNSSNYSNPNIVSESKQAFEIIKDLELQAENIPEKNREEIRHQILNTRKNHLNSFTKQSDLEIRIQKKTPMTPMNS